MSEPAYLKAACTHCGGRIEFPATAAGATVSCPHCGQETLLAAAESKQPPPPPPAESDATPTPSPKPATPPPAGETAWDEEPLQPARCPSCGLKVTREMQRCGNCGYLFVRSERLARRWGAVVILVLAGVLAFNLLPRKLLGRKPTKTGLEIINPVWQKSPGGNLAQIRGSVQNHSPTPFFDIRIEFDLLDRNGGVVGTASDYTSIIDSNKTWNFKALAIDPEAVNANLKEPRLKWEH